MVDESTKEIKKSFTTNSCHTDKTNKQKRDPPRPYSPCPFGPLTPGWRGGASPPHLAPLGTPCSLLLAEHWALCSSVQAVAIWRFSGHLIPLQFWVFKGWNACRDYSGKGREGLCLLEARGRDKASSLPADSKKYLWTVLVQKAVSAALELTGIWRVTRHEWQSPISSPSSQREGLWYQRQ